MNCITGYKGIRKIILLETDKNKKGDLFNRMAYDIFHALGFGDPRFNVPKCGREIDLVLQHRTENRVALVECKAHAEKVGGPDVNKFAGILDLERGKYERDGSSVVGYFISQSGFRDTVYEQEEERAKGRKKRNEKFEIILLGPSEIVRELIQGHVICPLEQAINAVTHFDEELYLCEEVDLLVCEEGWIWVLYYARFPRQKATHFAFVHADGNQLLNSIADIILWRTKRQSTAFSNLSYIKAVPEDKFDEEAVQVSYFQYLENELGIVQFEGMPMDKEAGAIKVDLENIFVPLWFYKRDREAIKIPIEKVLNSSLRAAVLAKPGGGKSTLIRRIALAYAYPERRLRVDDGLPDRDWLPVYIRCRDLENNATRSIREIIGTIIQRAEIIQYERAFKVLIENVLQDGRMLLLIDGLDEISEERYRICFANQLRTFIATYPSVHLLITSREAGFRAVAGTIVGYCKQYTISGLEEEQIRLLSQKWHQAILGDSKQIKAESDSLCKMILCDVRIVALAENPLLLTTLLFVKRCVGYLPTKRCRLYEEMIKLLLVTWNAVAHDKLDMDETEPQLAFVAYCMMEEGLQKITRDRLESCIIKARKELPEILGYTTISPAKFIEQVEERSSLLIQMGFEENDRGQMIASYEFSHLSFQEYLAAKAIVNQWTPDSRNMTLLKALKRHMEDGYWREVIPLASFLSGRHAQPLIEYLIKQNEDNGNLDTISSDHNGNRNSDITILHLANCIASEVPMKQDLLKKSILLILKRKSLLDSALAKSMALEPINIFDTIAKSKYGNSYRESVKSELFYHHYEDRYVFEFSNAWIQLSLLENENSLHLDYILSMLESKERQNRVTGVLLMAEGARIGTYLRNREEIKSIELMKRIFTIISQMLNTKDYLSVYSAAKCIAWSGYEGTNIIPYENVADIADKLVDLWLTDTYPNLKYVISKGLYTVCMPELKFQNRSGLKEIIEDRLGHPKNYYDVFVAIKMDIIMNQRSKEDMNWLKMTKYAQAYEMMNSRFLKEMGICPIDD